MDVGGVAKVRDSGSELRSSGSDLRRSSLQETSEYKGSPRFLPGSPKLQPAKTHAKHGSQESVSSPSARPSFSLHSLQNHALGAAGSDDGLHEAQPLSERASISMQNRALVSADVDASFDEAKALLTAKDREARCLARIELLKTRISELEEQQRKSLKSKMWAYLSATLLTPGAGSAVYEAATQAGWDSKQPLVHLTAGLVMVVAATVTLTGWQCFGCHARKQQEEADELHNNKKYQEFLSAAIEYFKYPHPAHLDHLKNLYKQLPKSIRIFHKDEIRAFTNSSRQLLKN